MEAGKEVIKVKLSSIIPNRFQPRIAFNEEELNELANSIKMYGILQPLILRPIGDKYEIIAGERRYKASTIAGLTEVPAILVNLDDQTSAELAIIENIQRKDLTAIEEAKSYKKLLDLGNLTQDQLATKMGKKQSTIANKLRLLNLVPEAQDALLNNSISERHARSLLQLKDEPAKQRQILNRIMEGRLTVKETDDLIKSLMNVEPIISSTPMGNDIDFNNNENNQNLVSDNSLNSNIFNSSFETPSFGDKTENIQPIQEPMMNNDVININEVSDPNLQIPTPLFMQTNVATQNNEQNTTNFNDVNSNSDIVNSEFSPIENVFNQTQVIDINAIKEAAKEEKETLEIPNFDGLLKVEEPPKVEENIEPVSVPKIGEPVTFGNKYFPSLEDEVANMTFATPFEIPQVESAESILSNQPDLVNSNMNNFNFGEFNIPNLSNDQQNGSSKIEESVTMIKDVIKNVQDKGIKIESQESDLPNEYQFIIRIQKDPTIN